MKSIVFDDGTKENELWSYLSQSKKPIVMYGMGNGADKIISVLESRGIYVSDFFASDGFVRGQLFHGKEVLSLSRIKEKYGDFIILVAFGSTLPEVCAYIKKLSEEYELYAPDVPVCGEELFDLDFYTANKCRFDAARALLSDDASRFVFDSVIKYKISGKIKYLFLCESDENADLCNIFPREISAYCDLGAYTGDTLKKAFSLYDKIKKAVAFEPSAKTAAKLSAYVGEIPADVRVCEIAAWDKCEMLSFADGAARNSAVSKVNDKAKSGARMRTVQGDRLDSHCDFCGEELLIKYDVEGAEERALLGSSKLFCKNDISLLVSAYHRSSDLFRLTELIHDMLPFHKIYLRKQASIPAWDINLYVTK